MKKIEINGEAIFAEINEDGRATVERDGVEYIYIQCEECDEWIEDDEICHLADGTAICIDCIEAGDFCYCDRCEEYERGYNKVFDGDCWQTYCDNCLAMYCERCDECERWFTADLIEYSERAGLDLCPNCKPASLIGEYHDHNPAGLIFHGDVTPDSYLQGYIGYEDELFTDDPEAVAENVYDACGGYDFCHFEEDATVNLEIIGQPHTLEMIYHEEDRFRAMFEAIRQGGGCTGDTAGLHVHFSRSCFGQTDGERADRIAKVCMLFSNDEAFEALAKVAKRDVFRWCNRQVGSRSDIKAQASRIGGRHSMAVNLEHHATVEFRLGRSVDNWDDFIGWIEVLAWIVKKSASIEEGVATCLANWMVDAPAHVIRTLDQHGVFLGDPAQPLSISDYEAIIYSLVCMVQDVHGKRNVLLRNIGLDDDELPRIPMLQDILRRVAPSGMAKGIILG